MSMSTEKCQWKSCICTAEYVYYDMEGDWLLCPKHLKTVRRIDQIESGLTVGAFGGVFAEMLDKLF